MSLKNKSSDKIQAITDNLKGYLTPIEHEGKKYLNRKQLTALNITEQEKKDYFTLNSIKVVANGGYINILTPLEDYYAYLEFKDKFKFKPSKY